MDNQPANQSNQQDREIAQLEQQLRDALNAEKFFETNIGILWKRLAEEEITKAVSDISSDKYEKDHGGYVKRLADLQAYRRILRKMQVAGSPQRKAKIQEKLDTIDGK